ncbi:MAG: NAD(P)/FAD-dependent oxidoreductase [Nanoarchaeota archaeon]|nr:NAD(P)/FAD-dependent oxidoreductase [Nanoarchaeota archaeon]
MISIIGAGPVGNYLAYLLAKNKRKVIVFEEHKKVGEPVQCTGIVSNLFKNIIAPSDSFVVNKVNRVRIYSPEGRYIELKIKENFVLDRAKFDQHLKEIAEKEGVKFILGAKFIDIMKKNGKIEFKVKKDDKINVIETDFLIGADGPQSRVAKSSAIYTKRKFLLGHQARIKYPNDNAVEFYPYIGQFAWIVPEDKDTVRIGIASYHRPKPIFDSFLKKLQIKKSSIIEMQAGIIPIYDYKFSFEKKNIFLVGDAACQVKATTGGGIIQGLIGAKSLATALIKKKSYSEILKRKIGLELFFHSQFRKVMDRFSEKDWNELVMLCNKKRMKKLLFEEERDNLIKLGLKAVAVEPRLLRYWKFLF